MINITLTILLSSALAMLEISTYDFGTWFPDCIQKSISSPVMTMKQVWFSLKTLDDVLTHLHAMFPIIIQQSCAIFVQTFCISKSLMIIFQKLFSWLAILQTVNQWLPPTTCLICLVLTLVLIVSLFWSHHSPPYAPLLFGHLVPLNTMLYTFVFILIHFLKHFKCLWWSLPKPDQKFLVYLLFGVFSSVLITD